MNILIFFTLLATSVVYGDEDRLIFCCTEDNEKQPLKRPRISEEKCEEYRKCVPMPPIFGIVGGLPALPGEFPHMALIGWEKLNSEEKEWQCGGTLVSEKFVMTAAHCTYARDPDLKSPYPKFIRLGERDISSEDDDENVQNFEISKIILHPEYKAPRAYHDIALLRLSRDAVRTTFVNPACLWQDHQIVKTQTVKASGWGRVGTGENRTNILMKVDLNIVDNQKCSTHFPANRRIPTGITDNILCAGDDVEKDTCQGDSGGPLSVRNETLTCSFHVVGITSFGRGCGTSSPGAYTRVSSYIDWIESEVWLKN